VQHYFVKMVKSLETKGALDVEEFMFVSDVVCQEIGSAILESKI
jgi:hypothetical protein